MKTMSSDQNVETFAVCPRCGTLSVDLAKCDSCSTQLTEEAVLCYTAEPPAKRARVDDNMENRDKTHPNANGLPKNNAGAVPQQLFTAPAPGTNSAPEPVPQALFVNAINNRQGIATSSQQATLASTVAAANAAAAALAVATTNTAVQGQAPQVYMNVAAVPGQAVTTAALQNGTNQLMTNGPTVSTLNSQMPPLVPTSSQFQSNNTNGTQNRQVSQTVPNMNIAQTNAADTQNEAVVHFNAFQVRMGSKKFIPSVPVEVKATGILMTLQGSVRAPVLINARAITSCKVNWGVYPVILVYLENSCIKQLRNIFGLNQDIFNASGNKDIQRRITIFPDLKRSNTSIAQLRTMFNSMQKIDNGKQAYRWFVTEISEEVAIDSMIDSLSSSMGPKDPPATRPQEQAPKQAPQPVQNMVANQAMSSSIPAQPQLQASQMLQRMRAAGPMLASSTIMSQQSQPTLNHLSQFSQSRMMTPAPQTLRNMQPGLMTGIPQQTQQPMQQQTAQATRPPPLYQTGPRLQQQQQQQPRPPASNMPQAARQAQVPSALAPVANPNGNYPVVSMPTTPGGWAHLKKTLSKGLIYQVVTRENKNRFAVWNGDNFLFCLVKESDTKVELECSSIRIGSLTVNAPQPITIQQSGISLQMRRRGAEAGIESLFIPAEDLQPSSFCIHKRCSCLLIDTGSAGGENIRKALKMPQYATVGEAYYNPKSKSPKYRHIVVYLVNVSTEQKNALAAMKTAGSTQNMFKEIHFLAALNIIEEIDKSTGNEESSIAIDNGQESDDDDCIMLEEEVGFKCPYTQQIMKFPVRNKVCNHNYEKEAILQFINNKKGNARCPYAGCGNKVLLRVEDLEDNFELKRLIENEKNKS